MERNWIRRPWLRALKAGGDGGYSANRKVKKRCSTYRTFLESLECCKRGVIELEISALHKRTNREALLAEVPQEARLIL